jgi:hypothetical protein
MMGIAMKAEKHVLNKIIESLYLYSNEITVASLLSNEKLQSCLQNELICNPELFFVNGFKLMYSPITTAVYPSYSYDEATINQMLDSCRKKRSQLISRIQGNDNYSRVLQAHDFLARNIRYINRFDKDLHTIVGPFTKKQGVCEGYAKAFKYLLDMMNIPCQIVYGYGCDQGVGVEESHAWNMIQLYEHWLHVDVTFDTTIRSEQVLRYDYFGLSTKQITRDHRFDIEKYPAAECSCYGYYERNNLVMNTRKQLRDYVSGVLRSGKTDCVFKLPDSSGENLDSKVSSEIQNLLKQLGKNLRYTINYNLKHLVFHLHFGE